MRTILSFVAVCFTVALIGCQTTNPTVAPGAVSECGAKCGQACTKDKSECCGAAKCDGTSMGAVSEKSDCGAKSNCTKPCDGASMGAVSEKTECGAKKDCSSKSDCQRNVADEASLGAVSEKTECGAKRSCGAAKSACNR